MFKNAGVFLVIFILIHYYLRKDIDDLIVELVKPGGRIKGHLLKSAKGRDYYAFQQIPYGKPPIGERRFRPPEPHESWEGILDCTENTKICIQFSFPEYPIGDIQLKSQTVRQKNNQESEDCLHLNVYTPVKPESQKKLPVYVYFHGGAFAFGDGTFSKNNPSYLIDGEIVIVTINYRLGPLGFLSTGDHVISGNMGLKDQHLALKWIRDNIHLFGGNPEDIVIGGSSAGAYCVGHHLLSPKNKGLISGVIQQSGSHISAGGLAFRPKDNAMDLGRLIDPSLSNNTSHLARTLRQASVEDLVKAADELSHPPPMGFMFSMIWIPVIEDENGEEPFVTSPMHEDTMNGNFNKVPSLIGFNSEESLWFVSSDDAAMQRSAAVLDEDPSLLISPGSNVENQTLVGAKLKKAYTDLSFQEDIEAMIKFTSDINFIRAVIRQAELTSKYIPVYLYQLSVSSYENDKYTGVPHVMDLPYIWHLPAFPEVDEEVREHMLKLWWNFIKYKNPTPEKDPALQNIEWPTVEPDLIKYLNLNKSMSIMEGNPRNYGMLRDILVEYMKPPFRTF